MPRVSRRRLHKRQATEISEHFASLISSLKNQREIESFFSEFLTQEEKIMLAKRLVLYMMLSKNYTESLITSSLLLSHETIRTYNNNLLSKSAFFHKIITSLSKREKAKIFFKKLEKILEALDTIAASTTNVKARAKMLSGDLF